MMAVGRNAARKQRKQVRAQRYFRPRQSYFRQFDLAFNESSLLSLEGAR